MNRILIVGGGPAGAAAAILLARRGRPVTLLEASEGPYEKVCGEFLSGEALALLPALGVDPWRLGAVAIDAVTLAAGWRHVSARLPFAAASLPRRVLDEALLARAAEAGAQVHRGARVRRLLRDGARWRAEWIGGSATGGSATGAEAFLATGKHDLRGWSRPGGLHRGLVGLRVPMLPASGGSGGLDGVELTLFRGGYAGLQPGPGGGANLCLLARKERRDLVTRDAARLLDLLRAECPRLAHSLRDAAPAAPAPAAIAGLPFGMVLDRPPGPWRLGDQAAVTASFTGTGIALALRSAELAVGHLVAGHDAASFHRALAHEVWRQVRASALLSILLVRPWAQKATLIAARAAPSLLGAGAAGTRLAGPAVAPLSPR